MSHNLPVQPWTALEARAWKGFQEMRIAVNGDVGRALARDSGLTEADFSILVTLLDQPDRRISSACLQAKLGWEPSRLSHQVKRMERRQTVRRADDAHDRRGYVLTITPEGVDAMRRADPDHTRAVREAFLDHLTTEQLEAVANVAETILQRRTEIGRVTR